MLLAVTWYRTGQQHFLTRSSLTNKNTKKVSEYIISNSKNVAYATDLAIGRTKNEESGNGVHLQPLAFLKLALELTFLLLLTLNHNKECKSLSNTLGNYNLDVSYHWGLANRHGKQNICSRKKRMTIARKMSASDKQTFLCVFSQLR